MNLKILAVYIPYENKVIDVCLCVCVCVCVCVCETLHADICGLKR